MTEEEKFLDYCGETMDIIIGKRTARIHDPKRAAEIIDEIKGQFKRYYNMSEK